MAKVTKKKTKVVKKTTPVVEVVTVEETSPVVTVEEVQVEKSEEEPTGVIEEVSTPDVVVTEQPQPMCRRRRHVLGF